MLSFDTLPVSDHGRCVARGFSLVELMVALVLGLLLTAGMVQLFSGTRLTFQTNDALARVQENGRFAMEILKRELRMAGTHGFCAADLEINNHLDQSCAGGGVDFFDTSRAVVGWEYDGTGFGDAYTIPTSLDPDSAGAGEWSSTAASGSSLPTLLDPLVAPGSDVLVVRQVDIVPGLTGRVTGGGGGSGGAASFSLNNPHGLPDNAIVLLTDCATGVDVFQNRSNANASTFSSGTGSCGNPGPGNLNTADFVTPESENVQVFTVRVVAYYIGVNANTGQPGLYRLDMSNGTVAAQAEEIIEGAESLQILYGYSRAAPAGDGQSVNEWLTADQVPADGWEQVIAMRLGVLVRSPENADSDRTVQQFDVTGADLNAPGDGRLREPFLTTIALRNRVLVI